MKFPVTAHVEVKGQYATERTRLNNSFYIQCDGVFFNDRDIS